MNWKTTLILLVVVSILFAWVMLGENKLERSTGIPDTKVFHPAVKSEDVTKLVIERGAADHKEQIVLVKEEKVGWKLEKPIADRADEAKVRELLNKLEYLENKEKGRLEGEAAAKAPFGAVESSVAISRPEDKGGDVTLEVGAKIPGEVRFVRVVGKPEVYIVPKDVGDFLAWDLFTFRTKELFTTVGIDAGKVALTFPSDAGPGTPPNLHELVRGKDKFWRIKGEGGELADSKKVVDIITKVQQIKPAGIVADNPSAADLAKFGLDKPAYVITLNAAEAPPADPGAPKDAPKPQPKSETLKLGNEVDAGKEARYALFSDRKIVYKVDASEALRELRKDENGLRSDMVFALHGGSDGVSVLDAKFLGRGEVKLTKKDDEWSLELPGVAKCEKESVKALIRIIAELKIVDREPGDAALHFDKYGLNQPGITLTLEEGGEPHTIEIGSPVPNKDHFFYVRRADEARVFTTKLDDLPQKLSGAPLALRSKSLLKASKWEATQATLTSADGKTELETKKDKDKNLWSIAGIDEKELDEPKLSKVLDGFEDLKATDFVAEVTSESLVKYGLDKPSKLTVSTEKTDFDSGSKKKSDAVLLLGKRDGDRVYAMEPNGTAIGRIDAEFLDRIARGFRKGKEIFQVSSYDAVSLEVKEGNKPILTLDKHKEGLEDEWFLKGPDGKSTKLERAEVREKLLETFEKIEATRTENATDAAKAEHGLAPVAWRTITIHTRQAFGDKKEETKVLLLGKHAGEHDVYAMDGSGQELGVIYDAPVTKVDQFIANPPKAAVEVPPIGPGAPPQGPGAPSPGASSPPQAPPAPGTPGTHPSPAATTPPAPAPAATTTPAPAKSTPPPAPAASTPPAPAPAATTPPAPAPAASTPPAPAPAATTPPALQPPTFPGQPQASPAPQASPTPQGQTPGGGK